MNMRIRLFSLAVALLSAFAANTSHARELNYKGGETPVYLAPGEPTEVKFPGRVSGGYKRRNSAVSIERRDDALILFASDGLFPQGESILVRLDDGRSYSIRITRASSVEQRDSVVTVRDDRTSVTASNEEEEDPAYRQKNFEYAPPSQVAGLMREMILVAELGKKNITGYRASDSYKGQLLLDDGTIRAEIEQIFMGPNLWGYVINAENLIDSSQKLNPASFRIDGTRAVTMSNWELSARPLTAEQQLASKHQTKIYIVAKARSMS